MQEEQDEKEQMESAVKVQNLHSDRAPQAGAGAVQPGRENAAADKPKVRFLYKLSAFCLSVVTLSWFFEGMRQCKEAATISGVAYLLVGTLLTLALVGLQAFFIYCEERAKGVRTRNIPLFDKWYVHLMSKQKGDYTNRG